MFQDITCNIQVVTYYNLFVVTSKHFFRNNNIFSTKEVLGNSGKIGVKVTKGKTTTTAVLHR